MAAPLPVERERFDRARGVSRRHWWSYREREHRTGNERKGSSVERSLRRTPLAAGKRGWWGAREEGDRDGVESVGAPIERGANEVFAGDLDTTFRVKATLCSA